MHFRDGLAQGLVRQLGLAHPAAEVTGLEYSSHPPNYITWYYSFPQNSFREPKPEWRQAYNESGYRSTFRRADIIAKQVYDKAAPIPDAAPSPDRNKFLEEVATAVQEAADLIGAKLR